MKISLNISVLAAFLMLASAPVLAQSDSLGMPGDNLDLNAVLSIFKKSATVEDFEKNLNSASTKINNLDLNGDGQVDYLRVVDYGKDDFHSIVIQDPVSKTESQDVAVIEIVKKGDNTAHVQIVGDESLYGKDYIIEPEDQAPLNSESKKSENTSNDDVYASPNSSSGNNTHVMVNVWAWPAVTYVYAPGYSYWASPWYWGYYPGWYSPWRPYGYYTYRRGFYGYNYGFYGYRRYRPAFPHVHNYYYERRVTSVYVQKTAPHYGRRVNNTGNTGARSSQGGATRRESGRSNGAVDPNQNANRGRVNSTQPKQQNTNRGTNAGSPRRENAGQTSPGTNRQQRVNQAPRSNQGSPKINQGGGRKSQASPGNPAPSNGSRVGNSGGGGSRMGNSGGGGARSGGGGGRR